MSIKLAKGRFPQRDTVETIKPQRTETHSQTSILLQDIEERVLQGKKDVTYNKHYDHKQQTHLHTSIPLVNKTFAYRTNNTTTNSKPTHRPPSLLPSTDGDLRPPSSPPPPPAPPPRRRGLRLPASRLPEGDALVPRRGLHRPGQDGLHRVHQGEAGGQQGPPAQRGSGT